MYQQEFNAFVESVFERCATKLNEKAEEYTMKGADRLQEFKVSSNLTHESMLCMLKGKMVKHTVKLYMMLKKEDDSPCRFTAKQWYEVIVDHINYLIFTAAILEDSGLMLRANKEMLDGCAVLSEESKTGIAIKKAEPMTMKKAVDLTLIPDAMNPFEKFDREVDAYKEKMDDAAKKYVDKAENAVSLAEKQMEGISEEIIEAAKEFHGLTDKPVRAG